MERQRVRRPAVPKKTGLFGKDESKPETMGGQGGKRRYRRIFLRFHTGVFLKPISAAKFFDEKLATFLSVISLMGMKMHMTYKHSLSIMAGLAVAILVSIAIAGGQVVASIETESPAATQTSEVTSSGGYTVVYKDPNGPWPGESERAARVFEVTSGVFIDRDKGFDI